MAKLTGPLLSMGARGQIGKTLVTATWRGVAYARQHVVPANPRTTAQQTTRTTFAALRELWKLLPALARAPWEAYATGRKFTGMNAFVGENMRVVRGQPDMSAFIGSPGSGGGLGAEDVTSATGAGTGEIDLTITAPDAPDGWLLKSEVAVAFPDFDPSDRAQQPVVVAENDPPTGTITLSGFESGQSVVWASWLVWEKPDGKLAYGVGVTGTETAGA